MAVAKDATSSVATGANVTTRSWTHTPVGTPSAVVVGTFSIAGSGSTNGSAPSSVTYGGTSMTLIGDAVDSTTSHLRIGFYYLASPATGAQTVSVTWPAQSSTSNVGAFAITVTGDNGTNPTTTFASNPGNSTTSTVTPVSPGGNDLTVAYFCSRTAGAGYTAGGQGTGEANIYIDNTGSQADVCSDYRQPATSSAMTHTVTTGAWFAASVNLVAAGAGVTLPPGILVVDFAVQRAANY